MRFIHNLMVFELYNFSCLKRVTVVPLRLITMSQSPAIDYKEKYEAAMLQIEDLQGKLMQLTHQLGQLQRMIFGTKSERYVPENPAILQPSLFNQEPEGVSCSVMNTQTVSYVKTKTTSEPKPHPGRMKLPEALRRETVVLEPHEDVTQGKKIGEDITEILEWNPGELFVKRFVRPKYVVKAVDPDPACDTRIVMAELPERPLEKCMAGPGLLAQIIADKYLDHLPLNRQMQRFSRVGVNIPITTLTGWVSSTCSLLEPLGAALTRLILQSNYLHADETGIRVLDKDKKGATHKGWFWVYQDSRQGLVFFDYQPHRNKDGPDMILKDFKGHLQTDGYETYSHFDELEGIIHANCMSHGRRKFEECLSNDVGRAEYVLQQMALLYNIERKAKDWSADDRLEIRQREAVPILDSLGAWMKDQYGQVTPKSAIGQALAYCIKRWKKLCVYTTDGNINIDNNPVERSLRAVALGRKNFMFCGSHDAARRAAMLYSLIGTCKLHHVNPNEWLLDVLRRLPSHPINRIDELLPHIWSKQRSQVELA
jgi:transposase